MPGKLSPPRSTSTSFCTSGERDLELRLRRDRGWHRHGEKGEGQDSRGSDDFRTFPVSEDGLLGDEPCLADTPHASMALDVTAVGPKA